MKKLLLFLILAVITLKLSAQKTITKTYENGAIYIEGQIIEEQYNLNDEFYIDESTDIQLNIGNIAPLKDGKWVTYYENGDIQSICFFDKGKRIGVWISYHSNKQISSKENYDTGEAVYFLVNGKKFQEGKITRLGLKDGEWKFWDEEENEYKKTFKNGSEQ